MSYTVLENLKINTKITLLGPVLIHLRVGVGSWGGEGKEKEEYIPLPLPPPPKKKAFSNKSFEHCWDLNKEMSLKFGPIENCNFRQIWLLECFRLSRLKKISTMCTPLAISSCCMSKTKHLCC